MNILVISSYFGPETSVGVLRINAFVKYWSQHGHKVHVVTMPYSGELPTDLNGNPNVIVHQVAPFFIGGRQSGGVQGYSKGAKGLKRKLINFQYWVKRKFLSNYLDPRLLWWPRVSHFVCKTLAKEIKFDFMISTVPSYTAHSAAAAIKFFSREIPWVADYRDLWSGNPIFPGCGPVRAFEHWHERLVLRNADLIVSINEPLISELKTLHGDDRKYLVVPNGFDDREVDVFRGIEVEGNRDGVSIVYAGSILPGLQDPTPLFQAIKELAVEGKINSGDVSVKFYGDYSALENFPMAFDPVVEGYIDRCGKVPRQEILRVQKNADFLLFLGSKPVVSSVGSTTGVVSGKIFEYLISGTEVMAIGVTDDMIVAEMLGKSAVGDHYGRDVAKLKRRVLNALASGVRKVEPNMDYLNQFRRSVQAESLITEVKSMI
ncbi:glycosyltransferase [Pseudomonas sp. GCM10022186]|uniref:glycosyltransferase n=1 Tax=Pseudomonas sp. GCM10022186 TaxID=3252650 RepID=UPI0036141FE0